MSNFLLIRAVKSRRVAHVDQLQWKGQNVITVEEARGVGGAKRNIFTDLDLLLEEVDFVLLLQKLLLLSCNLVGNRSKDGKLNESWWKLQYMRGGTKITWHFCSLFVKQVYKGSACCSHSHNGDTGYPGQLSCIKICLKIVVTMKILDGKKLKINK